MGIPPPGTGSFLLNAISRVSLFIVQFERRFDPFFRPCSTGSCATASTACITGLINKQRKDQGLALAEERPLEHEEEYLQEIIDTFTAQIRGLWNPGHAERGGNTKTHGIVRAYFTVNEGLPEHLRRGIFAEPKTLSRLGALLRARARSSRRDIDDVGFMSISVKLMGVPGPKLLDDEQHTLDMFGVSPPTFVTPDTRANAHLQHWSLKNAPIFHFVNSAVRTCSTASCSSSGRRRRRARWRTSTSAASRTCSARGRRCSTRSGRG